MGKVSMFESWDQIMLIGSLLRSSNVAFVGSASWATQEEKLGCWWHWFVGSECNFVRAMFTWYFIQYFTVLMRFIASLCTRLWYLALAGNRRDVQHYLRRHAALTESRVQWRSTGVGRKSRADRPGQHNFSPSLDSNTQYIFPFWEIVNIS